MVIGIYIYTCVFTLFETQKMFFSYLNANLLINDFTEKVSIIIERIVQFIKAKRFNDF